MLILNIDVFNIDTKNYCFLSPNFVFNHLNYVITQAYKLLCPDGSSTTVDNAERCNWGVVSSNLVMTSAVRDPETVEVYKKFLTVINLKFGSGSGNQGSFNIYKSEETYAVDPFKRKVKRKNLLFSDNTKDLIEIKDTETYFSWAGRFFPSLKYYNQFNLFDLRYILNMHKF